MSVCRGIVLDCLCVADAFPDYLSKVGSHEKRNVWVERDPSFRHLRLCVRCANVARSALADLVIYEPFDYTPAGAAITGQINNDSVNSPVTWVKAGTTNVDPTKVHQVASGSLTAPSGFAASVGNSATLMQSDNTEYNRLALEQQYGPTQLCFIRC